MGLLRAFPGGIVTREQQEELRVCDPAIVRAVVAAREAGVPQGLIVALLHGHAETARMVGQ